MARRARRGTFVVYMLRCQDGSLYTGYTCDIERRLAEHNSGHGARYVRNKAPAVLVWMKPYVYLRSAMKGEIRVKRMRRAQKLVLIEAYQRRGAGHDKGRGSRCIL